MSSSGVTRGRKASRSIKESILASTGSSVTHTTVKATDSSAHPPKTKHVEALIRFSFLKDIDDRELCSALIERSRQKSWIPVLKSMICFHRILRDGAMPFNKNFAGQPGPLQLTAFQDISSAEGPSCSTFIQGYATYINLKAQHITKHGFDYCHATAAKNGDRLSTESPPKLFQSVESVLDQMRQILSFTSDKHSTAIFGNLVVKEAASLLFKDILKLWMCANNGTVNILENFFRMPLKDAKEGLRLYEQFVKLCQSTDHFVEVCSMVGCNNGKQIPTLGDTPKKLLPKLREHVKSGTKPQAASKTNTLQTADDSFDPRAGTPSSRPPPPKELSPSQAFSPSAEELPELNASANPANPFL